MAKLSFQHHYSSLQCHIILQNQYNMPSLPIKKHFSMLNMLSMFIFSFIFLETVEF